MTRAALMWAGLKQVAFAHLNRWSRARAGCSAAAVLGLWVGLGGLAHAANPYEGTALASRPSEIDQLVRAQWKRLKIEPAAPCSDAVFVRRVHLDVIGTLPTALEAQEFLLDRDPDKRAKLIDRLLEREEFADYWAMKWSDLLRVKAEFPVNLWPNAAQAYHRWIRDSIRDNKPHDRFVREMLTASGSNFRDPPVNFYRAIQDRSPEGIAATVALNFMGVRTDRWPSNQLSGMAGFFAQVGYKSTAEWKEEIVFNDAASTNVVRYLGKARRAAFPGGGTVVLGVDQDPRGVFADWLVSPENPWFACNLANRTWSWVMGRGIIHEPDDIRADNPPSNPRLLAYLEREFRESGYDFKQQLRLILNSQTYQLSPVPRSDSPQAAANFAYYPLRRLDAEVLIDAINQITGSSEKYSSAIPEPFTFIPEDMRSIALPDGSITSSFLEMFGRPSRDTGLEAERSTRITAEQRLHLLNSSSIQRKIGQSRMVQYQTQSKAAPAEIANAMYLGILSRYPSEQELRIIESYAATRKGRPREMVADLAWALINNPEFLLRH